MAMAAILRVTVSRDGAVRAFPLPLSVPAGRLPGRRDPGGRSRLTRSSSRRRPARARPWSPSSPSTSRSRPAARLPTPRRSRRSPTRSSPTSPAQFGEEGRPAHRRRQGEPARAAPGDDHRDPPQHALYGTGSTASRYVVLDECHYMGDEERGTVWEEIIVYAPARRPAGRALGHRRQRPGDRRLDLASSTGRSCRSSTRAAGAARLPDGRPGRRDPRPRRASERAGRASWRRAARRRTTAARWYAAGRRSHRADRGAGGARLAAGHLLHLQPGGLRAGDGGRARPRASRCWARAQRREVDQAIAEALSETLGLGESELNQSSSRRSALGVGSITPGCCRASSG